MNEPLFRNAHEALVFAFNYLIQQYGKTPMSRIAVPASRSGKGLSGVDGSAQSGMIRRKVHSLGRISEAFLIARYAPHEVTFDLCPCPKCDNKHPNKEWTGAINTLAEHIEEVVLEGCSTTWDMCLQYATRFFIPKSSRVSFADLAERNNVTEKTVRNHHAEVKFFMHGNPEKKIPGLEQSSMAAIESILIESGMVITSS